METVEQVVLSIDEATAAIRGLADQQLRNCSGIEFNEPLTIFSREFREYALKHADVALFRKLLPLTDEIARVHAVLLNHHGEFDDPAINALGAVTKCADAVAAALAANLPLLQRKGGWRRREKSRLIACAFLPAEYIISKGGAAAMLGRVKRVASSAAALQILKTTVITRVMDYANVYFSLHDGIKKSCPEEGSELGRAVDSDADGGVFSTKRMEDVVDSLACFFIEGLKCTSDGAPHGPLALTLELLNAFNAPFNMAWANLIPRESDRFEDLEPGAVEGAVDAWAALLRTVIGHTTPQGVLGMDFQPTCDYIIMYIDRLISVARREDGARVEVAAAAGALLPALEALQDSVAADPHALWIASYAIMHFHVARVAAQCMSVAPEGAQLLPVGLDAFCDDITAAIKSWIFLMSLPPPGPADFRDASASFLRATQSLGDNVMDYFYDKIRYEDQDKKLCWAAHGIREPATTLAMLNLSATVSEALAVTWAALEHAPDEVAENLEAVADDLESMDRVMTDTLFEKPMDCCRKSAVSAPAVFRAAFAAAVGAAKRAHVAVELGDIVDECLPGVEVGAVRSAVACATLALAAAMEAWDDQIKRETGALLAVMLHLLSQDALGLASGADASANDNDKFWIWGNVVQMFGRFGTLVAQACRSGVPLTAGAARGLDVLLMFLPTLEGMEKSAETLETLEAYRKDVHRRPADHTHAVAVAKALAALPCSRLGCTAVGHVRAKKCSRCLVSRYCGAECQTQDWKPSHKAVCALLKREKEAAAGSS